jgi:hypothetical protein
MNAIIWSLAFGIVGFAIVMLLTQNSVGDGWELFKYFAGIASLLVSGLVWMVLSRDMIPGPMRGAGMGTLVGLLSHPLTWYLASQYNYFLVTRSPQSNEPLGPISGMAGGLVFSFWSLLLTGWITVPVAAGLGVLVARALRSLHLS